MNFLLDTNILLWWLDSPEILPKKIHSIITDENNEIFVSAATAWEISIKKSIGKLKSPDNLEEVIAENFFKKLFIDFKHVKLAGELPLYHKDPFDRLIIAQAIIEKLAVISSDDKIAQYQVKCLLCH